MKEGLSWKSKFGFAKIRKGDQAIASKKSIQTRKPRQSLNENAWKLHENQSLRQSQICIKQEEFPGLQALLLKLHSSPTIQSTSLQVGMALTLAIEDHCSEQSLKIFTNQKRFNSLKGSMETRPSFSFLSSNQEDSAVLTPQPIKLIQQENEKTITFDHMTVKRATSIQDSESQTSVIDEQFQVAKETGKLDSELLLERQVEEILR